MAKKEITADKVLTIAEKIESLKVQRDQHPAHTLPWNCFNTAVMQLEAGGSGIRETK